MHDNPKPSLARPVLGNFKAQLAICYAFFALVATLTNIAAQELLISVYDGYFGIPFSVLFGTGVGMVVKYFLDKRFIFRFRARDFIQSSQTFALYVLMSFATTAIFWGFEFVFHYLFFSREMRYLGALIGLTIGYIVKYRLDGYYVFKSDFR